MKELEFEWDKRKEAANVKKHGVTFEEARTAFYDESAIQFYDPDHSEQEDRFILLGLSLKAHVLVVCHCFRESETVVRIISARKPGKRKNEPIGSDENERALRFFQNEGKKESFH
jgi:uncharacterized DUF497 family protein